MNKSTFSDRELEGLLSGKDGISFRILFEQYHPTLVRVLINYSNDQEEIKDWIQKICRELWLSRQTLNTDSIGNLKAYFIVTARNFAIKSISERGKAKPEKTNFSFENEFSIRRSLVTNHEDGRLMNEYVRAIENFQKPIKIISLKNRVIGPFNLNNLNLLSPFKTVEIRLVRMLSFLRQEVQLFRQ
ncbi:RNA polymerase sigma factor [Dyadobacter psychrotolerans]|uniref:Sigma-70 family RNA polymerase sigma factor n=1 Tax=Dyadobacter psychrotolerans TaxID=2541721 RepID=A0A4R5DUM3_9BACT|nr:sigma factor [Dyadobacter psychrotolerans]TDE18159.1 sigma-70 family RNA polymerase sigma factor [Dyadobacter psychrotolerans]